MNNFNGHSNDSVKAFKGSRPRMGSWRMFISYIWRSKEDLTDKPIFYSFLKPPEVGGGPFQKNKSYPHFLMLWSLYNRYLTLKIVSLQNQVPVRPNHFFRFSAKIGHLRGFPTFSQMLLWSPKYLFLSLLIKSNFVKHVT